MADTFTEQEVIDAVEASSGTRDQKDAFLQSLGIETKKPFVRTYTVTLTGDIIPGDEGMYPETFASVIAEALTRKSDEEGTHFYPRGEIGRAHV